MLSTILTLIVGGALFFLALNIIFAILGFILRLIGATVLLPFKLLGGIILLPILIIVFGISLVIKLLPIILLGSAGYFIYKKFYNNGYWYN